MRELPCHNTVVPKGENLMTTNTLNRHDHAIRLLAKGFGSEFCEFVAGDERMHELLMDLASEFVEEHIPVVKEDDATDVAMELIMSTTVREV